MYSRVSSYRTRALKMMAAHSVAVWMVLLVVLPAHAVVAHARLVTRPLAPLLLPRWSATATPAMCVRPEADDDALLVEETLRWLDNWVIRHNLCPFASGVRGHVRTVVCRDERVLDLIADEATRLRAIDASEPATTLVLLPAFADFSVLMELQEEAEARVRADGDADIQLLVFHPAAEFDDSINDPADLALRSPHPLLHLLRDSDVTAVEEQWIATHGEPPTVQERNAAYLRGLGWQAASDAVGRSSGTAAQS